MKSAVVTGATGFIGRALTIALLKAGTKVYAIDLNESKLEALKEYGEVVTIKASFKDYQGIQIQTEEDIDVFYHFAWQGVFGEAFKDYELQLLNTKYAGDAICLAKRMNCKKFVFAGTMNEYEVKNYLNKDYFMPRYTCIYSTCKLAAEMICKTLAYNMGIAYNGGLIAIAYGEGNSSWMLPNVLIKQLLNNQIPKLIEGNSFYDMIYIEDIIQAFIKIGEYGVNMKSYYIGHRKLQTFREIVTQIRDILNPEIALGFGEYKDTLELDYNLIDLEALHKDTGFECAAGFKESILKTAEWVKQMEV